MRRTKIIATLGPATESPGQIAALLERGVSVFRLNCSHASAQWVRTSVPTLRKSALEHGVTAGIMLDLQGPAIRTGDLVAPLPLTAGEPFVFTVNGTPPTGVKTTSVNYENFARDVEVGRVLLVDNGELRMRIAAKSDTWVECEVLNDGLLGSRRHINLPGIRVSLPALTEKDRADVALGLEVGVDFFAQSFVRDPDDVCELRALLAGASTRPTIVAKIEHQFAVEHFAEIAQAADAVMVARGDLGIECPYEDLPIIQRRIVKHCLHHGHPVIVATQMLESMIENPFPTRAEITDVANAVFEQADGIMLSGETAVGRHPNECVTVMDTIARRIERSGGANYHLDAHLRFPREMLMQSAVDLANKLKAAGLMVFTRDGQLARTAAWLRPNTTPIFAFCDGESLARQMTLLRGVHPVVMPACGNDPAGCVTGALARLRSSGKIKTGDSIVVVLPHSSSLDNEVEAIKMHVVDDPEDKNLSNNADGVDRTADSLTLHTPPRSLVGL
ncbi:MAG TPA: pyruvate kinase [Verrucomicrobiota bacterium]|nr:pyruvate kinase [Verrucomicrobiota bacterium]